MCILTLIYDIPVRFDCKDFPGLPWIPDQIKLRQLQRAGSKKFKTCFSEPVWQISRTRTPCCSRCSEKKVSAPGVSVRGFELGCYNSPWPQASLCFNAYIKVNWNVSDLNLPCGFAQCTTGPHAANAAFVQPIYYFERSRFPPSL
jgi:hypothetical protein